MILKEKGKRRSGALRLWFWLFAAAALIAAVCMPDRGQMFAGLGRLCVLPYQSANPYFAAENGGFAGTFLNVALVCAICAAVYSLPGSKPDGVSVLAFFLTAGFAFWGITVLNIWFCFAGTLIRLLCPEGQPLHAGQRLPVLHGHCTADDGSSDPLSGRGGARRNASSAACWRCWPAA